MCVCVFQLREEEFDIITQLPQSQGDSKQIKHECGSYISKNQTASYQRVYT